MSEDELIRLVSKAKGGCTESLWLVKYHFWKRVSSYLEETWYKISSEEQFERHCEKVIEEAVNEFMPDMRKSLTKLIEYKLSRAKRRFLKKFKERKYAFDCTKRQDIYQSGFDVRDDLAVVDDGVLVKEKIASLAGSDPRKMVVLEAWSQGFTNDSEIALFLAEQFGGKTDSHRKYIIRFRTFCQRTLSLNAA